MWYDRYSGWFGNATYPGFVTLTQPYYTTWTGPATSWTLPSPTGFGGAKFAASNLTGNIQFYYELRDASNVLLYNGSSSPTLVTSGAGFTWVPSGYTGADVSTVKVFASAGVWAMDDVTLTPEPCTLALVGLGLAGVGLRRRRSRAGKGRQRQTAAA